MTTQTSYIPTPYLYKIHQKFNQDTCVKLDFKADRHIWKDLHLKLFEVAWDDTVFLDAISTCYRVSKGDFNKFRDYINEVMGIYLTKYPYKN